MTKTIINKVPFPEEEPTIYEVPFLEEEPTIYDPFPEKEHEIDSVRLCWWFLVACSLTQSELFIYLSTCDESGENYVFLNKRFIIFFVISRFNMLLPNLDEYAITRVSVHQLGPKNKSAIEVSGACIALITSLCTEDIYYLYALVAFTISLLGFMRVLFNVLDISIWDVVLQAALQTIMIKLPTSEIVDCIAKVVVLIAALTFKFRCAQLQQAAAVVSEVPCQDQQMQKAV